MLTWIRPVLLVSCAALAVGLAGSAAAPAAHAARGGSILYERSGKLWVMAADGKQKRRIPHAGRFENPSQADDGTVVAQRGINLHRMDRRGRRLNRPFTTAFRTNPVLSGFDGPFWPQVSPNGRLIAYSYSFRAETFDYSCNCVRVIPSLHTSYTSARRFTDRPDLEYGNPGMYSKPSWIDSHSVLLTSPSLFDFAGNVLDQVAIDAVGGSGDRSYQRWFSECTGCESLETLQLYPLDDGEMTRSRDKLAFVAGPLGGATGDRLFIYPLSERPPAIPSRFCQVTGASRRFDSPTWSPDGRSLAWADGRGVWVGRLGDLSGSDCEVTRRLVAARGSSPDWGPAAVATPSRRSARRR